MRLTLVWVAASRLPPIMVMMATAQMMSLQLPPTECSATMKTRASAMKAAALVPTDINAVIVVGAPS